MLVSIHWWGIIKSWFIEINSKWHHCSQREFPQINLFHSSLWLFDWRVARTHAHEKLCVALPTAICDSCSYQWNGVISLGFTSRSPSSLPGPVCRILDCINVTKVLSDPCAAMKSHASTGPRCPSKNVSLFTVQLTTEDGKNWVKNSDPIDSCFTV